MRVAPAPIRVVAVGQILEEDLRFAGLWAAVYLQPKIVFAEGRNKASESLKLGNGAVGIGDFDDALATVDVQLAPQAIAEVDGIVRKLLKAGALCWQQRRILAFEQAVFGGAERFDLGADGVVG